VDPNAFRSSRNSTLKTVEIRQFQGNLVDLSFLAGFDNVNEIEIAYIENLKPITLPALPCPKLPSMSKVARFDGTDRIDCYSDRCQHLNWLIRDNRHLLDKLTNARCILDGTVFEDFSQSLCDAFGITSTFEPPTELTKKTELPDSSNAIALSPISTILFPFLIPVSGVNIDNLTLSVQANQCIRRTIYFVKADFSYII